MQADITPVAAKSKSLYRELTIALVVLVTLASLVVNWLNFLHFSNEDEELYEARVSQYSEHMRESFEWPLWNIDDELIVKVGDAFASNDEIAMLTVRDDRQRIVYNKEKLKGRQISRLIAVKHEGRQIGSVEIGLKLSAHEERERHLLISSTVVTLLLIVILLSFMRWTLARLLKKPVDTLVGAIGNVVDGHYPTLDFSQTYQEFSPILTSFKVMADAVASRENNLRQSNEHLALEVEERQRAEEALKASEERWKFALEGAGDGVWDWNIQTDLALFSSRWKAMIGYAEHEFPGTGAEWLMHIHPDDKERVIAAIQDYFSGKRANYVVEFRMRCKDGSWKWLLARGMLVSRDECGNPLRMLGTHTDISERKKTEAELIRYKDHLEEEVQLRTTDLLLARNAAEAANRAKSVFLSSMSHELRTPLNAVLGFSSLLRKDAELTESQRDNLDIINRSGEHLLTLINDVLEMAKIEAGRVQLEITPLDLGALARDVSDMMSMRAREKGLRLLVEQSSDFPRYIKGDEARLRQILINLVGNAVKFTQQGGVTLRFGLNPNVATQQLLIEVEDTGVGISEADQPKVFQPFVQFGEVAAQKGTGLGLSITRQFVQLMGGTISFASEPGKGSIFRVALPVERVASVDVVKPDAEIHTEVLGLAPGQPEYRILIVEDQLENQLLLTRLMTSVGLPVKLAENGEQALALFKSWQPHLIWMDWRMPVMDGLEATQRIRSLPGGGDVKIVAVTASVFMEQREAMRRAGVDEVVRKPYRFSEIYESMAHQLGLQYLYADTNVAESADDVLLTSAMLSILPLDLRGELRDALESLETERIEAVIHQIASYDKKLYKTLIHLANNFDYPSILQALPTD